MEVDPPQLEVAELRTETVNAKTVLLGEFIHWSEANNHSIYLVNDYICEDGRFCLELSMEDDKSFTLFCPSNYPNSNEDNFFVEANQSLQFWCNSLNEFILDSEISLKLPTVLNKAVALYLTKKCQSPCDSSSDSESAEAEFCDEFMTVEGEWDEEISILRKRWRNKEAQIRAVSNKPKTSDMFDGALTDHPKQVFSNSAASGILTNDLVAILQSQRVTGINAEAVEDNIYKWSVFIASFGSSDLDDDLKKLQQKYGYNYIELQLDFTMDLHPFYPPIVKVIRPRLIGTMMMQVSSMDMLKLSHWNAARDMKSVLLEIKEYLGKSARLDINSERNDKIRYPQGAYNDIENHLLRLAWVSEIPTRAHARTPSCDQDVLKSVKKIVAKPITVKGNRGEAKKSKIFPAGTGFSSSLAINKGWDINAHLAAQKEKDKQIENVLQNILQELCSNVHSKESCEPDTTYSSFMLPSCSTSAFQHNSSEEVAVTAHRNDNSPVDPTDDLFSILEASSLVPFLETKLQVDSFFEISRHRAVYRCIVDILSELAMRPKLVPILWNLPNQAQSLYELVSKVDVVASTLLERIGKVSSNGTVPKSGDKQNLVVQSTVVSLKTEPEEEEKLARDFHQMSQAVTEALTKHGFLSMGSATSMDGLPLSSVHHASRMNGTDESLSVVYKNALKDMQFLSCDIEVDGPASHHFASKFKRANPPSAKQLMRIAQEMATLSTSLPLDLGSSIFIRTDDGKCTLLRALIIGPECTPYSSGCFVFDIYFPSLFPTVPPNVHLCTTGLGFVRFNPNLYANGTVCLSLLGTWKGMPGETWNAVASTLLQVLVSIQSLIFVPEPYFNEPGFEACLGTEEGKTLSKKYNLDTMINTINHAMTAQIERPASGFKDVIHTHFRIKGKKILRDIEDFMATNNNWELSKAHERLKEQLKIISQFKQ